MCKRERRKRTVAAGVRGARGYGPNREGEDAAAGPAPEFAGILVDEDATRIAGGAVTSEGGFIDCGSPYSDRELSEDGGRQSPENRHDRSPEPRGVDDGAFAGESAEDVPGDRLRPGDEMGDNAHCTCAHGTSCERQTVFPGPASTRDRSGSVGA